MASELRRPDIGEIDDCAKLIYISGPDLYTYIFVEEEPEIYEFIKLFYRTPGNPYSNKNVIVEE
ncbi:hypothetical protein ACFLYN_06710, partial [Chloroflexota bacterium]